MELVSAVRTMRGEMNVPPGKPVPLMARAEPGIARLIVDNRDLLSPLARIETWTVGPEIERPRVAASAVFRGVELWLPLDESQMPNATKYLFTYDNCDQASHDSYPPWRPGRKCHG